MYAALKTSAVVKFFPDVIEQLLQGVSLGKRNAGRNHFAEIRIVSAEGDGHIVGLRGEFLEDIALRREKVEFVEKSWVRGVQLPGRSARGGRGIAALRL